MNYKLRREALGLTQMDLAINAKVSISTVVRMDRGELPKKVDTLQRINKALKIGIADGRQTSWR
jgi:predicted transcriptional regulator